MEKYYCKVCGKELEKDKKCAYHEYKYVCAKHYQQILKYGHPLDTIQRSTFDLNDFVIDKEKNIAIINLYNRKNQKVSECIIDIEDLERVIKHKWRYWKGRVFTGNLEPISLQYFILNIKSNGVDVIDHINSNPLDNRKCNLRYTTQGKNCLNKSFMSNRTSGFEGVWYDTDRNKWCAEIKIDHIKCYLGRHDNKEDAVYLRYMAETYVFKEYRSTQNDNSIKEIISKCKDVKSLNEYLKDRLYKKYNIEINIE